jgi:hypothetical protein
MTVATPDWLTRHGGAVQPSVGGHTWIVFFDSEPQYSLSPIPVGGQHGCRVVQTINGKRLDTGSTYPTEEDAVRGGLEQLRQALGW